LAVHQVRRADDLRAEGLADRLMAETHPEDGRRAREAQYDVDADACVGGRARPGRDHDVRGRHDGDLLERDLVVADDLRVRAQLAEVLDEVVRERVVVVDDEDHRRDPIDFAWAGQGGGSVPARYRSRTTPSLPLRVLFRFDTISFRTYGRYSSRQRN